MDIQANSVLLHNIYIEKIASYLKLVGWKEAKSPNDRWLVFEGEEDALGEPLEIVLSKNEHSRDYYAYLASSVNLLSALKDEPPETVITRINCFDTDVLKIRNPETGGYDSISIKLAAKQVPQLKNLIAYSASSERDPRPHFYSPLNFAEEMVNHYRFAYAPPGSFNFVIKSEIRKTPIEYTQLTIEKEEDITPFQKVNLPIERRVMERIIRGLLYARQAARESDSQLLIESYMGGFNSKMCDSIFEISNKGFIPLEYKILWSPRIMPSEDLSDTDVIRLEEREYNYLKDASKQLSNFNPKRIEIDGKVIAVSSKDAPTSYKDIDRSVVIRWSSNNVSGRAANIIVYLDREDYIKAHDAHIKWKTVRIEGVAKKVGNIWRLAEPRNFQVID